MISATIKNLEFSEIRKLNRLATEETINLGIGRPFCQTPEVIKQAGINAIIDNQTYYSNNLGIQKLREVISDRYALGTYENALVTVGAAEAIYTTMVSFLSREDEVLIPNPGYLAYGPIGEMIGCKVKQYDLTADYQLDLDQINALITNKTKMIIINNPGNPTGVVLQPQDLKALMEIASANDLVIVSDEAYQGLSYSGVPCPSLADFQLTKNNVVISSVSKEYSMTGWRVGWIYTHQEYIDQLVKTHLYINSCATTISQHAAYAALKENPRTVVQVLKENKKRMRKYLDQIENISYIESSAGLYYFIDVSYFGEDRELAYELLEAIDLLTIPGSAFGNNGTGCLRLSFGAQPEAIEKGMTRLVAFLNNYERK